MPAYLNNSKVQIIFNEVPGVDEVINLTETSLPLNMNTIFKDTRTGAGETKRPTYVPENFPNLESWTGFISTNYKTSFSLDYNPILSPVPITGDTNFEVLVQNDFSGTGVGTVTIFANFENAVFVLGLNTTTAEIIITNKTSGGTTPTSGSNILNLTWDGATDDNGISGYQLQWRTSTELPWSPIISVAHDPTYGLNTTTSGGGFYNHSVTQLADHIFRVRIVDSESQYSLEYKYITASVNKSTVLISAVGAPNAFSACGGKAGYEPINPILITGLQPQNVIVINVTCVKKVDNSVFDGQDKFWRILFSDTTQAIDGVVEYSCKIDDEGIIRLVSPCSSLQPNYTTVNISSGLSSISTSICSLSLSSTVYYTVPLTADSTGANSTIIYRQVTSGNLTDPFPGANKYYVIGSSIVKISSSGKVLSKQTYSSICSTGAGSGTTTTCCFVKGTKVSMFDNTNKNIEDIKVGDIVITYNEETKLQEPGEVTHIMSPLKTNIVEYKLSNSVIVKSTTCHPYWIINKGWSSFNPLLTKELYDFDAEQIKENDILLSIDYKEIIIEKITELITKEVTTYNLAIIDNHTYYANGILVHNKSGEPTKYEADGVTITSAWNTWFIADKICQQQGGS
jgi:hypothetical protein